MKATRLILLICFLTPAHSRVVKADKPLPPVGRLTSAERQRLFDNLRTVEENLARAKENLATSQRNRSTVEAELNEVATLEKELGALKSSYENYLSETRREWEKLGPAEDPPSPFRKELEHKISRAQESLHTVQKQLRDVVSRKGPLEKERLSWEQRINEHQKWLQTFEQKKASLETRLGTSNPPH